jgi:hypothetical protein
LVSNSGDQSSGLDASGANRSSFFAKALPAMIIAVAMIWVLAEGALIAPAQKLSPDANSYLDIARNLSRGEGFVLKNNIYQSWLGTKRGALAYQQPVYPVFLAALRVFKNHVSAAILANALFSALALLFLYAAWRTFLDPWKAALALWPIAFSDSLYTAVSQPLTEASALCLVAAAFPLLFASKPKIVPAGLLLGFSMVLRAANIFGIVGLVAGCVFAFKEDRGKIILKLIVATFAPLILFQVIGWLLTGDLYPGYGPDARIFRMTRDYGGAAYQPAAPALRFLGVVTASIFAKMLYHNVTLHLWELFLDSGPALFLLALLGLRESRDKYPRALFAYAVGHVLLLSLAYYFIHTLESVRYALSPLAVLPALALVGLDRIAGRFPWRKNARIFLTVALVALVSLANANRTLTHLKADLRQYFDPEVRRIYIDEPAKWVTERTARDDLLATNYMINSFRFDRPVVSLPIDRQLSPKTLDSFLKYFKPKAVLVDDGNEFQDAWRDLKYLDVVRECGYELRDSNERFKLLVCASCAM